MYVLSVLCDMMINKMTSHILELLTGAVQKNTCFFSFKEDLEFPVHSHSVYEKFIGRYMYIFI